VTAAEKPVNSSYSAAKRLRRFFGSRQPP